MTKFISAQLGDTVIKKPRRPLFEEGVVNYYSGDPDISLVHIEWTESDFTLIQGRNRYTLSDMVAKTTPELERRFDIFLFALISETGERIHLVYDWSTNRWYSFHLDCLREYLS
jgi:hypothetical protein